MDTIIINKGRTKAEKDASQWCFWNLALQLPETRYTHTGTHSNFSPAIKGQCAIQTHQVALKQQQLSNVHQYGHKCPL